MSSANPNPSNPDHSEVPAPASERSRPTDPHASPAPLCEALDGQLGLESEGFDFHDTIPAPTWLDDGPDTAQTPLLPPP
ncbi:MAG: hypothetical protein ABJB12_07565 [Pseudomonadota bacterium]